jgi:CRP/FNR family transcriptional regulator, polysaccharide utilization system transcription regulator
MSILLLQDVKNSRMKKKMELCEKCVLENEPIFLKCSEQIESNPFSNKNNVTYRKGDIIIRQGAQLQGVFCIKSGFVKIVRLQENRESHEFILWYAEPGEILGLDSFINNEKHTSSAIAMEDCRVCYIPIEDFTELLHSSPQASLELMKILCNKIDYVEGRLTNIVCKSIGSRLVEQLLQLAIKGKQEKKGTANIIFNAQEVAEMIGTTKNYLYKLLLKLSKKGLILKKGEKIKILDIDKLLREATGELKKSA